MNRVKIFFFILIVEIGWQCFPASNSTNTGKQKFEKKHDWEGDWELDIEKTYFSIKTAQTPIEYNKVIEENKKDPTLFVAIGINQKNLAIRVLKKENIFSLPSLLSPDSFKSSDFYRFIQSHIQHMNIPDSKKINSKSLEKVGPLICLLQTFPNFNGNYSTNTVLWFITQQTPLPLKNAFLINLVMSSNPDIITEVEIAYPSPHELIWKQGDPSEVAIFFLTALTCSSDFNITNPIQHYSLDLDAFQMVFTKNPQ